MLLRSFLPLLLAALALSAVAAANDRLPGDLWLTNQAQNTGGCFEPVAKAARAVTSTQTVLVLGALLAAVLAWKGERRVVTFAVMALIVLPFLQAGIKNAVGRPRPGPDLVERRASFTSESFPSGHTMSGTVLFLLVVVAFAVLVPARWIRVAGVAVAAAVLALSMSGDLYLGMHWPSDVVGGLLWAGVLATGSWALSRGIFERRPHHRREP